MKLLGVDIGGTKTGVCVGNERGKIYVSERMRMSSEDTIRMYRDKLAALCSTALAKAGLAKKDLDAVGISAPGALDVKKGILIAPPNNPTWKNVPVVKLVRSIVNRPIHINNDANACVLAEYLFGKYKNTPDMLYLTCSTGMGGGIVANGEVVQGITDTAGEVGHHNIDINGPLCGCGMRGCFEAYVGGRSVAERLRKKIVERGIKTLILEKAGGDPDRIDHRAMAEAAREGDPFALEEWNEYVERMAQGVGNLIMILNPQVVLLGTIAIHEGDFLLKPMRERLKKYVWSWPLASCKVVPSTLGDRIGDLSAIAVAVMGIRARKGKSSAQRRK